ncbi:MAG: precorrin-8X methylmutase [Clostridiales bacterium]|nr:precorrin-8X methylmutase [Clostridiales bacterium]
MKTHLEYEKPVDIEARSMELIAAELPHPLDPENEAVIKRVIHTTADFDYVDNLTFTPGAVEKGVAALRRGCSIVTDTTMAQAGINKRTLARLGGRTVNFIADPQVAAEAKARGVTRSAVSMKRAAALREPLIYAIGNAPTALIRLCEMVQAGEMVPPALVVGVPVGFVNVVEAKELLLQTDIPSIVARGRKGGSSVAAAICNALLYQAAGTQD